MTIRERLSIIGQALTGSRPDPVVKEIVKEIEAAKKSITGGFLDFSMMGLSNETRISTKLLEANRGWVYRNNDVIAKEVATIEFELFTVKTFGKEIVYDPVIQSPLLDLLDRFNEFTAASDGFYITQSHRKLAGDAFWVLDGKAPNIQRIFILPPDKVQIKLGKEAGNMRVIEGYELNDTIDGKSVKVTYPPEKVIHFKVPNPKNFYRGLSAVEAAADAIDTDNMAIEANKKLFERGLINNFILTTDKNLTPEQRKQLNAEFNATYQGVNNAFKVPIISGGLKPESVQMTNKDMEFIAQQTWVRDKIASIFGNNKAVLGITDDVNRANAEATITAWKRTTVRADMKGICDTLNEFLVPMFGENLVLGFKDPVPEDEAVKVSKATTLYSGKIITRNEAREILSLDEVEGGDEFDAPTPSTFTGPLPKSLKYVKLSKILRKSGVYEQIKQYEAAKKMMTPTAKKLIEARKPKAVEKKVFKTKTALSAERVEQYYGKQMRIVDVIEKMFLHKVERFINDLVDKAIAEVPNEIKDMQNKALFNEEDLITQATIDFTPLLMEVATASGNEALKLINQDKPYLPTNIRGGIEEKVKLFATSMVETDKNKLIDIITEGVNSGASVPDIRRNITDTFSTYSKMQAERITRTEVLRASTMSTIDAWQQSGVVEAKEWLVAPGAGPECEQYNGKVISLNKNFYSTSEFADGDPPIHPNCRCVVLPVLKGERSIADEVRIEQLKKELEETKQYTGELEEYIHEQN